ncbi:hypothetical protein Q7P37_008338 [Cladosporium fusiforme]
MPSAHSIPSINRPSSVPQSTFDFPADKHLLITTPSHVLSWDYTGLHTLFKSSKSGIAAATESKDGSGILAIADKHTVVLHDTKREKEKSWGLSAEQDEVRHLEYSKDSNSLFLSTKVTNTVQCYSTQSQQLLSPPQTLSSPPAALAVSPTGHLMVSAQGTPPVVYLKDLVRNSTATLMKPQSSTAGVAIAAFHPERANIFLLAFDDGTLAVFDASRLSRIAGEGKYVDQSHVSKAEIGRKRKLHKAMSARTDGRVRAITGAAFLPGQKLRIVTVGMDGRCQLVGFSEGANILRTWHGKAPLTSVSVSAPCQTSRPRNISTSRKDNASAPSGNDTGLLAIGTYDGSVLLYNFLGLLQSHQEVGNTGERIIHVEWINGQSPKSIPDVSPVSHYGLMETPATQKNEDKPKTRQQKEATPKHLKAHPALKPPALNPGMASPHSRRFTIHPDEVVEESTVRHTPTGKSTHKVSAEAEEYLDLFSPVNPFAAGQTRTNRDQSHSPMRIRPRISSQTFVTDSTPLRKSFTGATSLKGPKLEATVGSLDTSSDTVTCNQVGKRGSPFRSNHAPTKSSPLKTERRKASQRSVRKREPFRRPSLDHTDASAVANARLLHDLRQMSAKSTNSHTGSVLQAYASSAKKEGKRPVHKQNTDVQEIGPRSATELHQPIHTQMYGPDGRWPTDSANEPSLSDEHQEDDIWITSDEERKRSSSRRNRLFQRPVARQCSRSRVNSNGTISTTQSAALAPDTARLPVSSNANGGVSTEDYVTAQDGAFSLASDDVKSLFPRSSSVSPRRNVKEHHKRSGHTPRHQKTALQEIASNSAGARRPSDPWSRVKQAKSLPLHYNGKEADPATHVEDECTPAPAHSRGDACGGCAAHASKVKTLEGEVAVMKGEILALRAMLRRHGVPTPAIPRR